MLDSTRMVVADLLWAGADLPEPLNKDGVRLDWVTKFRKQSNVWVRGYWDGKRLQIFRIKWKSKSAEIASAGLMD